RLAGQQNVQRVMNIVAPLRRVLPRAPRRIALEIAARIVVVLEHEMDVTPARRGLHGRRQLLEDVRLAVVAYRVNGVEAKPVDVELLDPVKGVVDEEVPHHTAARSVEVDRRTPGRRVPLGEELRGVVVEVITLRPEVIVNDVEKHHETARMRRVDEPL